jgi:hypothetical protein
MEVYANQQLENIVIDESLIKSISWENKFQDVAISIDWCGQEDLSQDLDFINSKASLHFDFVTGLDFSIKFEQGTMGALEITSFSFEPAGGLWKIEFIFKFYPVGYLRFTCNDFRFVIESV